MTDIERICKAMEEDRWHTLGVLADACQDADRDTWVIGLHWLIERKRRPVYSPQATSKEMFWWGRGGHWDKRSHKLPKCLPKHVFTNFPSEPACYFAAAAAIGTYIKEHGSCEF